MTAVFAWMQDSLRLARERDLAGMVIFAQADPDFELRIRRKAGARLRGVRDALARPRARVRQAGPVVNGDTHLYKLDKPLQDPASGKPIENFTR